MNLFSLITIVLSVAPVFAAPKSQRLSKRKNFLFAGVNESGAEFGTGDIPGVLGTDYTWPVTSSIDVCLVTGTRSWKHS